VFAVTGKGINRSFGWFTHGYGPNEGMWQSCLFD